MPLFPSEDWMEAFCDHLRADPRAEELSAALDGVYRFVVEPSGPLDDRHVYDVVIRPGDPEPEIGRVTVIEQEPRLSMTADYERWRQLIRGELDIAFALMLRRLKVSGDLSRLTGRVNSAKPLTDALAAVDTEWR